VVDLLVSVLAASVLAALALAALAAVTLAPFVVALQAADARHRSAARWGALALAGSGTALAAGAVLHGLGARGLVAGPAVLVLAWAAPLAARRARAGDPDLLGVHR
jgi:hypothetical protein